MKRIISIILTLVMLTSVCAVSFVSTDAAIAPMYMGDLNWNYKVEITDITFLQRILARVYDTTVTYEYIGDVDKDDKLTIFDATIIQKWLADLIESDIVGLSVNINMHTDNFYANYSDGMAMVGVPVTFTVDAQAYIDIVSYNLYVNEKRVATSTTDNSLEYTFEEPGNYFIEMYVTTELMHTRSCISRYTVVEPYDIETPVVKGIFVTGKERGSITYSHDGMKAYAEAIGGTAPYQYKFVFRRPENLDYQAPMIETVQDYSNKNYFELPEIDYDDVNTSGEVAIYEWLECELIVYVKDANGTESSRSEPINYMNEFIYW